MCKTKYFRSAIEVQDMWLLKHSVSNALEALTHSKSLEHIIRQWPSRSTLKSCRGIGQKASGKANEFWELGKMVWELREGKFPIFNTGFSFDFFTKTFRKATKHQQTQPWNGGVPRKQATTAISLASLHGRRRTAFAGTSMQRGAKGHWLCLLSSKSKGFRRKSDSKIWHEL